MANVQSQATSQLAALPFGNIIGGPLNAAVEAQARAAQTSVDFIQAVAFTDSGDVRSVTFLYESGGKMTKLIVPILAIVPIPYIRIEDLTISFKANISAETTSSETANASQSFDATNKTSVSGAYWFVKGTTDFTAAYSSKKDSTGTRDSRYSVEYTMDVMCRAVQDNLPAGLSKVLSILEKSIEPTAMGTVEVSVPATGVTAAKDAKTPGTLIEISITVKNADGTPAKDGVVLTVGSDDESLIIETTKVETSSGSGTAKFKVGYGVLPVQQPALAAAAIAKTAKIGVTASNFSGSGEIKVVAP